MNAMWMQIKAEILRIFRNPYFVFWSLLMPILFYGLFTKVFNTGLPDAALWQAHYLMSMTVFSVMGSSIMTLGIRLVEERTKGWTTFMRLTPLPFTAYFFAKMIGQTVVHFFSIMIIFFSGALMNGISLTVGEWVSSGFWILAGSLPFLALGTLVGTMRRVDTASGVSNLIYMGLAISGGLWMPMETLPSFIQDISLWLPSFHFGDGAWQIIRGGSPDWMNILVLGSYFFLFMILSSYIRRKQEAAV
ncbi:ABC transporter permease [Bacillus sp. V3-13]|uniref:ABC transporter permease n=1 Tax=Bacillus sp. V3-13 TaxID=2053728 RepID=UPI000C780B30|nr:ABC transporter permease [Bacillus sp. V3-13]PLR77309.1 ABC transporter permease [Bacillus sp. V3-13]